MPDLLVMPQLFNEPDEGWTRWACAHTSQRVPRAGTISDRIIKQGGPMWMYGLVVSRVITGILDTDPQFGAEAIRYRKLFESGYPLFAGPLRGVERYTSFFPTRTYRGNTSYQFGQSINVSALSHGKALQQFRTWYFRQRENEIQSCKRKAKRLKVLPLALDVLIHLLRLDKVLYNRNGQPLVWLNEAHGRHGVQSKTWCYLLSCVTSTAVRLGYLGLSQDRRDNPDMDWESTYISGNVAEILGLEKWQQSKSQFSWTDQEEWRVQQRATTWHITHSSVLQLSVEYLVNEMRLTTLQQELVWPVPRWNLTEADIVA